MQAAERADLQVRLEKALEKINFEYDIYICSRFSITLGDELQGGLYSISPLFEILDIIKQSVSPSGIRFGIGIDGMSTEIKYNSSFGSDGPAYHCARAAVEKLKKIKTNEYGYMFESSKLDTAIANDIVGLADSISRTWSPKQKEYIASLQNSSSDELSVVAKSMGVNVSSISRAISKADYRTVNKALVNLKKRLCFNIFTGEKQNEFLAAYNRACDYFLRGEADKARAELKEPGADCEKREYFALSAMIYSELQEYRKSIEFAKKALSLIDGDRKCQQVRLLNILGVGYTKTNEFAAAEQSYASALSLLETEESTESWRVYTLGNLAILYSISGRFKDSETLFKKVLALTENNFAADLNIKVTVLTNLGILYSRNDMHEKSAATYKTALTLSEAAFGKNSVKTATLKYNYALLIMKISEEHYVTAYELLNEAVGTFKRLHHTSKLRKSYSALAELCTKMGERLKAAEYRAAMEKLKEAHDV